MGYSIVFAYNSIVYGIGESAIYIILLDGII